MNDLVPLGPSQVTGRMRRPGSKIPVEIIAADRGEKDKTHQSPRSGSAEQQMTGLPDHQHRATGNVQTAENKKIEYFSKHSLIGSDRKIRYSEITTTCIVERKDPVRDRI